VAVGVITLQDNTLKLCTCPQGV